MSCKLLGEIRVLLTAEVKLKKSILSARKTNLHAPGLYMIYDLPL